MVRAFRTENRITVTAEYKANEPFATIAEIDIAELDGGSCIQYYMSFRRDARGPQIELFRIWRKDDLMLVFHTWQQDGVFVNGVVTFVSLNACYDIEEYGVPNMLRADRATEMLFLMTEGFGFPEATIKR